MESRSIPESAHDAAAEWVRRRRQHCAFDETAFQEWLSADSAHVRAFRLADAAWSDAEQLRFDADYEALLGAPTVRERGFAFLARLRTIRLENTLLPTALTAACAAVLLVGAFAMWQPTALDYETYVQTDVGEIRDVELRDGSTVTLSAQSKVSVNFDARERRVVLDEGQAFFAVEKDPARQFIVVAGDTQIVVVGTQFDVRFADDKVRVGVLEGVVEVEKLATAEAPYASLVESKSVLTAGQQVTAIVGSRIERVETPGALTPGTWRRGRLVYRSAELSEIVADANRYFPGRIVLGSPDLATERLTTSFRADQVDQLLDTLEQALSVEVRRQNDGDILLFRLDASD